MALFLSEQRINIGVNMNAGEAQRHGVLWATIDLNGEQQNVRIPVIIDKPNLVSRGMNYATWRRVKRQIEKMGIKATHLELKFDPAKFADAGSFCYKLDKYKELYNERQKGQPLYQTGFA
jgi:hypothetical protein